MYQSKHFSSLLRAEISASILSSLQWALEKMCVCFRLICLCCVALVDFAPDSPLLLQLLLWKSLLSVCLSFLWSSRRLVDQMWTVKFSNVPSPSSKSKDLDQSETVVVLCLVRLILVVFTLTEKSVLIRWHSVSTAWRYALSSAWFQSAFFVWALPVGKCGLILCQSVAPSLSISKCFSSCMVGLNSWQNMSKSFANFSPESLGWGKCVIASFKSF